MPKYKCTDHKLNFACLGCINAWIARHDRMLEYIRKVIEDAKISENYHRADEGLEVLKEIGKL